MTEAEVDAYTKLLDEKYNMKVEAVRLKISKTSRPMQDWEFVVADGRYQGRREWKYHLLDKDRIGWLKRDLFRAGLELEDISS